MELIKKCLISTEFWLLLPMACLSLMLFLGYKSLCVSYKNQKHAKTRYTEVLYVCIFVKSTIFAPFVFWILKMLIFQFYIPNWLGFWISWGVWCLILWFFRKIYKKIERSDSRKLPSSFYNEK
jgi:hypothetical protein